MKLGRGFDGFFEGKNKESPALDLDSGEGFVEDSVGAPPQDDVPVVFVEAEQSAPPVVIISEDVGQGLASREDPVEDETVAPLKRRKKNPSKPGLGGKKGKLVAGSSASKGAVVPGASAGSEGEGTTVRVGSKSCLGKHAHNVFTSTSHPFMGKVAEEDPEAALEKALGCIYEAGVLLACRNWGTGTAGPGRKRLGEKGGSEFEYWMRRASVCHGELLARQAEVVSSKDEVEALRLELKVVKAVVEAQVKELASRGDGMAQELEGLRAEKEKAVGEVEALKARVAALQSEVCLVESQRDEARADREGMMAEKEKIVAEREKLREELTSVEVSAGGLKCEVEELRRELGEASSKVIERFLCSEGFLLAAQVSLVGTLRSVLYSELRGLGKIYPFVPEQLGYTPVSKEEASGRSLSGYKWDQEADKLFDPEGKEVPARLSLQGCSPSPILYTWDKTFFPRDPRYPSRHPRNGPGGSRLGGGAGPSKEGGASSDATGGKVKYLYIYFFPGLTYLILLCRRLLNFS